MNRFEKQFRDYEIPNLGWIQLPEIEVTKDDLEKLGLSPDIGHSDFLKELCRIKFKEIIPKEKWEEYGKRVKFELDTLINLGFTDYVLLIKKIIDFCNKNDIYTGYGRGSASGSLCFYLLGITKVDPIKHNLLFERFISAARAETKEIDKKLYIKSSSLPDVDCDIDFVKRHLVKEYLNSIYIDKCSQIVTFHKLTGKIVIKECCKAILNYNEDDAKRISAMIEKIFGKVETISNSLENNKRFKKWTELDKKNLECALIAISIEDLIKSVSVHASAVFLTHEKLNDISPTELSKDGNLIGSYDMQSSEKIGVKVDLLGLKTLSCVRNTLELIDKKLDDIDINDASIYNFIKSCENYYGFFQAEKGLGKETLHSISPDSVDEIALSVSLGRPGAMSFIPKYLQSKKDGIIDSVHEKIDHILKPTANLIVYQEQGMKICREMAKMTPQETDKVRKGIGKKKREIIDEMKPIFIKGSIDNGFDKQFAEDIWSTFEKSADYQFNLSHALAYSYLLAVTVYLKANYPKEFFLSLLKISKYEQDQRECIRQIIGELPYFDIKLLGPHLLKSDIDFKIEDKNIRFGLGSIKGIAEKNFEKIIQFQSEYKNKIDIFTAAKNFGLNISVLAALIQSGALEGHKTSRSRLTLEAQLWYVLTEREQRIIPDFIEENNYDLFKTVYYLKQNLDEKGKPYIKESRFDTISKKIKPYKDIYEFNRRNEKLSIILCEKALLGFFYSGSLYDIYKSKVNDLCKISDFKEETKGDIVKYVGSVEETKRWKAKNEKKTDCFKIKISDQQGEIDCLVFNEKIEEIKNINDGILPQEDDVVLLEGKVQDSCIFIDHCGIQDVKVMFKKKDLKNLEKS